MYLNSFPPSTLNDLLKRSRQIKNLPQKVPYDYCWTFSRDFFALQFQQLEPYGRLQAWG
jgi:hypothetical protein